MVERIVLGEKKWGGGRWREKENEKERSLLLIHSPNTHNENSVHIYYVGDKNSTS